MNGIMINDHASGKYCGCPPIVSQTQALPFEITCSCPQRGQVTNPENSDALFSVRLSVSIPVSILRPVTGHIVISVPKEASSGASPPTISQNKIGPESIST
jgi:hypothetical protein